jgi:hypothetical protein
MSVSERDLRSWIEKARNELNHYDPVVLCLSRLYFAIQFACLNLLMSRHHLSWFLWLIMRIQMFVIREIV